MARWPRLMIQPSASSGQTSWRSSVTNSVNSPIVRLPAIASRPPTRSTAAIPSVGRKISPGRKRASTDACRIVSHADGLRTAREAVAHVVLAAERLHHLDADDRLVRRLGQVPLLALHLARDREHPVCEEVGEDRDRRHREGRGQGELRVDDRQDDRGAGQHQDALDRLHDAPADEVPHRVDVVRRARDHLAGRVAVVEGAREAQVRVVELRAQPRLDGDADPGGRVAPREVDRRTGGPRRRRSPRGTGRAATGRRRRSRRRSCAARGSGS